MVPKCNGSDVGNSDMPMKGCKDLYSEKMKFVYLLEERENVGWGYLNLQKECIF